MIVLIALIWIVALILAIPTFGVSLVVALIIATYINKQENLATANFDPEFFEEYESAFVQMYNLKNGKSLKLKSKRKLSLVENFLFG